MAPSNVVGTENMGDVQASLEANVSAVSWAAILAGAAAAAVFSLILFLLGTGLGLSAISPWAYKGMSASAFGSSTIVWILVTQILASALGGYLAGRLRTKWTGIHTDEVYFRDTAHGFLTWAVATLFTAALLASAIGGIVKGGAKAGAALTGVATTTMSGNTMPGGENRGFDNSGSGNFSNSTGDESGPMGYFVDSLFRRDPNMASENTEDRNNGVDPNNAAAQKAAVSTEASHIFMNAMATKTMPSEDVTYVGQLVSKQTGLSQQDAEARVNNVYANIQKKISDAKATARDAAEKARKATVYATLWLFVSLLIGAFSASWAATGGGRCRDCDLTLPHPDHPV